MASVCGQQNSAQMDMDDDFLEAVFMNEKRCWEEGFAEGQVDGRRKGQQDAFRLGCQKGCEIGTEIGNYLGFAENIRPKAERSKNKVRALKALASLTQLIESFPLTEPRHPAFQEKLQAIRAKFKQVTSLLGIQIQLMPGGVPQATSF